MTRPLVTFCLITRNHEASIANAVQAALAQDFEPLEILVSDDASGDRTFDIAESALQSYSGPHAVRLRRNDQVQGPCGNLNAAVAEAEGELIVLAYGTDVSEPHRVARLVEAWQQSGASVLASNALVVDHDGSTQGLAKQATGSSDLTLAQFVQAGGNICCFSPTLAWHRQVFDEFGPIDLDRAFRYPDLIIPLRGLLLGGNHFIDQPLVHHRSEQLLDQDSLGDPALHDIAGETTAEEEVKQLVCLALTLIESTDRLAGREPKPGLYAAQSLSPLLRKVRHWVAFRNRLFRSGYQNLWDETAEAAGPASGD